MYPSPRHAVWPTPRSRRNTDEVAVVGHPTARPTAVTAMSVVASNRSASSIRRSAIHSSGVRLVPSGMRVVGWPGEPDGGGDIAEGQWVSDSSR